MKRFLSLLVVVMTVISASAQESVAFRYGCVSYDQILKAMPEYKKIDTDIAALKQKYDTEMKASEDEFNAKYEVFLSEQANYAAPILRKRQSELEDMMRRNEKFRIESIRLLEQARKDMIKPIRAKIDAAINKISEQYSLAFVLNTDSDAVPFMNMNMAYNINDAVKQEVGLMPKPAPAPQPQVQEAPAPVQEAPVQTETTPQENAQ